MIHGSSVATGSEICVRLADSGRFYFWFYPPDFRAG